ncbi:MAG TPA: hypothetical protein PLP17_14515, partial [Oligoflexia bacterium]|nr:hypothetical protein [Oligoflexia bacterium]
MLNKTIRWRARFTSLLVALALAGFSFDAYSAITSWIAQGALLPLTGTWNGFLNQLNIVECTNLTEHPLLIHFSLGDFEERQLGERFVEFEPLGTKHIILNEYQGVSENYGTYRITTEESAGDLSKLSCHTIVYRHPEGNLAGLPEYAYSLPVETPLRGPSYGIYNSMQPDPRNEAPVANWLSIYNPGIDSLAFVIEIYDQSGARMDNIRINSLPPGGRTDVALGHPHGQTTGIYRIIPEHERLPYGAYLTRYSPQQNFGFDFAFTLGAKKGLRDS